MKGQIEGLDAEDPAASVVSEYLRRHPDFLLQQPGLLAELELARAPGGAASLTSRQVAALREQNHELRTRLRELVAVARENDQLAEAMHALALAILRTANPLELRGVCARGFGGTGAEPPVALAVFGSAGALATPWWYPESDPRRAEVLGLIQAERPVCGRFKQAQLAVLFPGHEAEIGSAIAAPLLGRGWSGVLAIGSADSRHYHPEMAVDLIAHVAAATSVRIDLALGHHLQAESGGG